MRKLLTPSLSTRRMESLRPRVETIVDGLLDELGRSGPPADFHTVVSFPLPALVVCELLGVPAEDREDLCRWQIEAKQVSKPAVAPRRPADLAVGLDEIQPVHEAVAGAVSHLPVTW